MKHPTLRADLILLLAAVLWGGAFVAQRAAMWHMGPLTYNGIRFALGALALAAVMIVRSQRTSSPAADSAPSNNGRWPIVLFAGCVAGWVLFVAVSLQQAGMVYTTASKAGFITGLYLPLVPVMGLLVRQHTSTATWVGVVLAVVGLYFLSIAGEPEATVGVHSFGSAILHQLNRGDALVMACAVVWAVYVLLIGWFAPRTDPLELGFAQFTVVAICSFIAAALIQEPITTEAIRGAMWPILYGGFISVGIAYTLQLVGQRNAGPGHAALVLSLETVFSAIAGYMVLNERLGPRELFGAAVMFSGMLVSQVGRLPWLGAAATAAVSGKGSEAIPAVLVQPEIEN